MDNLEEFYFEGGAALTLNVAAELSTNLGMQYISELTLFSALTLIHQGKYHQYLIRRGLTDLKITENVNTLLNKYAEERMQTRLCDEIYFPSMNNEGKCIQYSIFITREFCDALVEHLESKKENNSITENDMLKILITCFPNIYEDYMDICFPSEKNGLDEITIPREMQSFLSVMNEKFSSEETECPILGRERETNQLIKILAKSKKKNAILIGEPGVGKTALVEKLAWEIVTGNCHEKFKKYKIIKLDVTSVIAGTKYRGMAEERFQELIHFLEENDNCILFIDEIHTILGAGACTDGELDLANSLKPILARGDTQIIGATTTEEYKKYFSKDGALKRRFETINVREPHSDEVYPMIKNQISQLQKVHGVTISKKKIDFAILNASCFNYETKNPDRTLDLIDRSMAGAELLGHKKVTKSDILDNFDIRINQFKKAKESTKLRIAYHEAGHYIVQRYSSELENRKTLAISIMPAEGYNGVNVLEEDDDIIPSDNYQYFIELIGALLGGRLSEEMYSNELSAGARGDLDKANIIAENVVTQFGLVGEGLTERVYSSKNIAFTTDEIKNRIDNQIIKVLSEAKKYAEKLLDEHKEELKLLVNALMEKGIINQKEIDELLKDYPKEV